MLIGNVYIPIFLLTVHFSSLFFSRSHPVKGSAHLLFTYLLLYLKHSSWATESIISSKEVPSILSALWKRLVYSSPLQKKYKYIFSVVRTHALNYKPTFFTCSVHSNNFILHYIFFYLNLLA